MKSPFSSVALRSLHPALRSIALGILTLLWLTAHPSAAHEIVVIPLQTGERLPVASSGEHLSTSDIDFGTVLVGHVVEATVELDNMDAQRTIEVVAAPPAEISVSPSTVTLQPQGSGSSTASLQLTLTPSAAGPFPDLPLLVTHDGVSVARTEILKFSGSVVDPEPLLAPASIDFGPLLVDNALSREVTITNDSDWIATLVAQTPLPADMILAPTALTLNPGASTTITLTREASSDPGIFSGSIDFDVTYQGVAGSLVTSLPYSGEIVAPEPILAQPTTLDFGFVPIYETRTLSLTVSNPGSVPAIVSPPTLPPELDDIQLSTTDEIELRNLGDFYVLDVTVDPGSEPQTYAGSINFEVTYPGITGTSIVTVPLVGVADAEVYTPVASPRGFRPNQPYQTGEIDSVDTASGNVTLRIPLGQVYEVGPMIRYQLTVVNNSNAWDYISVPCVNLPECNTSDRGTFAVPNASSNAGLGWELHFGKLFGPTPPAGLDQVNRDRWPTAQADITDGDDRWLYVAPDGAKHFLYALPGRKTSNAGYPWRYSKDGSFLRMRQLNATTARVEFQDGRYSEFRTTGSHLGTDFCGNGISGCWRFDQTRDPFGNEMKVTYHQSGNTESWAISDSTGRTHAIRFDISDSATAGGDGTSTYSTQEGDEWGDLRRVVTQVQLAAFSGTAEYQFSYGTHTIGRSCPPTNSTLHLAADREIVTRVLTQITVPESQPWKFVTNTSAATTCGGDIRGKVTEVTLPTRGKIQYVYSDAWEHPTRCDYRAGGADAPEAFFAASGIKERRILKPGGTVESKWTYSTDIFPNIQGPDVTGPTCERAKYRKTTVNGPTNVDTKHTRTVHYNSVWEGPRDPSGSASGTGWQVTDLGLPFSKDFTAGGNQLDKLFLSSQTFLCNGGSCGGAKRSIYRRYVSEFRGQCDKKNGVGDSPGCYQINPLLLAERTVFHDDSNKYVERRFSSSSYDGAGHFRTELTKDDFSGSLTTRSVTTNYSATGGQFLSVGQSTGYLNVGSPSSYLPTSWILTPYNKVTKSADGRTYVTEAAFQSGVRTCTRTWKGSGGRSGQDRVVKLSLGTTVGTDAGLPIREQVSGGELANVPTGSLCQVDTGSAGGLYTFDHTYSDLQLASTRAGSFPYRYRAEINGSTGLPSRVFNGADESQTLSYDLLGRLTSILPAASRNEADTFFTYSNPPGSNPSMTVERKDGGSFLSIEKTVYDHLGRQIEHEKRHPDGGTTDRHTKYDGTGNVVTATTRQPDGSVSSLKSWRHSNFDAFGRAGTTYAPDGQATHYTYNGSRYDEVDYEVQTDTGPKRRQKKTTRDAWGRTLSVRFEGVHQTDFEVDPNGNVTKAIRYHSAGEQERHYGYDARGFLLHEQLPELVGSVTYKPDALGLSRRLIDGTRDLSLQYDGNGRPTRVKDTGGRTWKEWTYGTGNSGDGDQAKGRLIEAIRYNYPPGREAVAIVESYQHRAGTSGPSHLKRQVQWIDRSGTDVYGPTFLTSFDYDALGNLKELGYPACQANTPSQGSAKPCADGNDVVAPSGSATYFYTFGAVTRVDTGSGLMGANYTYHPNHQLASVAFDNGTSGTYGEGTSGMARPSRRHFKNASNQSLFDTGTYGFDGAGNVRAIGADSYTYDGAHRLTSGTVKAAGQNRLETYVYDTADNLIQVENDGFGVRPFNIDPATNRMLGVGSATDWSHDASGNLTSAAGGAFTFTWDSLNMQTRHVEASGQYISVYGPGDYRVWVEDPDGVLHWPSRGPNGKILREFQVTGSGEIWAHEKDYVYGAEGILASRHHTGTTHYFHTDHLGTPRLLTNGAGIEVSRHHYYPFGREAYPDGVDPSTVLDEPSVKYTGHQHELHEESYYMLGRHYFPYSQRFGSLDPAREGWNPYAYTQNNPIRYVDPDGQVIETAWDIANLGIGLVSLGRNLRDGNYGSAALDGLGVVLDGLAVATPFVPGGAGTAIKAGRAANNAVDAGRTLSKGKLIVEAGEFSASEIRAAEHLAGLGRDVRLRQPVGTRAGGGTSDLLVDGVRYDVYTPRTTNPDRIISEIAKKGGQVHGGGIVLDLSKTTVNVEELGDVMRRIQGITDRVSDVVILPR